MAGRGKNLESRVRHTNLQYRKKNLALILYVEVPIKATRKGLIATLSTVDFQGIISPSGQGIAFDAKECKTKTSFPLSNIKQHQLEYLKMFEKMGGQAFFLIHFYEVFENRAFKTPVEFVWKRWELAEEGGRKSIPFKDFKKEWKVGIDDYLQLK